MQYQDLIGTIVVYAWITFTLVWLIASFFTKKYAKRAHQKWWGLRVLLVVFILIAVRLTHTKMYFLLWYIDIPLLRWIGAIIVLAGIVLAFWARYHLGRNWGQPMSEKKDAELVTTGPYAYIRNPIYSAVMLSMAGSILVFGLLWVFSTIIYSAYFIPSIFEEEKIMLRLFPDTYPAYKARTKRLIPWVW